MMTELPVKKPISVWKIKALVALTSAGGFLVSSASAATVDLSGVTSVIDDVVLIFPYLVDVVVSAIPILVILAIVGFILGLLSQILSGIGK